MRIIITEELANLLIILSKKSNEKKIKEEGNKAKHGRTLDITPFDDDRGGMFASRILNGGTYLKPWDLGKRYVYDGLNEVSGRTIPLSLSSTKPPQWLFHDIVRKLERKELYPLPLMAMHKTWLDFWAVKNGKKLKHFIIRDGFKYNNKDLNNYYNEPTCWLLNSRVNGSFGIKFVDSKYIFESFDISDKANFKITTSGSFNAPEVDFEFRNQKGQDVILIPKRIRTSAFWIDYYMIATPFTLWVQPVANATFVFDFIPFAPVPFGRLQGFGLQVGYIPKNLKDNIENSSAPSDYAIEYQLYNQSLIKHNPSAYNITNLFFAKIYISSTTVTYLSRIQPAKTGDLVAMIKVKDKYLYIWRKTDEELPNNLDYLAVGSMSVNFTGDNPFYSISYVRELGYDV